jgi:hypothetical protein
MGVRVFMGVMSVSLSALTGTMRAVTVGVIGSGRFQNVVRQERMTETRLVVYGLYWRPWTSKGIRARVCALTEAVGVEVIRLFKIKAVVKGIGCRVLFVAALIKGISV